MPEVKRIVRHRHLPAVSYKHTHTCMPMHTVQTWCPCGARKRTQCICARPDASRLVKAHCDVRFFTLMQAIYKASKTRRVIQESDKRKLNNRIKHSAPGTVKPKADRKKKVLAEVE